MELRSTQTVGKQSKYGRIQVISSELAPFIGKKVDIHISIEDYDNNLKPLYIQVLHGTRWEDMPL